MDCCDPPVITVNTPTVDVTVDGESSADVSIVEAVPSSTTVEVPTIAVVVQPVPPLVIEIGNVIGPVAESNLDSAYAQFSFDSFSPFILSNLSAGDIVVDCEIRIDVSFDDPLSTIRVGTPLSPSGVMSADKSNPGFVSTYGNDENYFASVSETLQMIISPGASTQGSGYVLATIRRA